MIGIASFLLLIVNGIIALCLVWSRSSRGTKAKSLDPLHKLPGPMIPVELKEECRYEVGCPPTELKEDIFNEMHVMPAELWASLLPELDSAQIQRGRHS